jgi:hypothetical protein
MEFVHNLLDLLKIFVTDLQTSHPQRFVVDKCSSSIERKVPMFFLATDSPKYIPIISSYTKQFGIETIVMPQDRVEKGVTFTIKQGQKCPKGWYDMLLDDIILSFSDTLVAARHSTFTQSMPMPLMFDGASIKGIRGPIFCEVGDHGASIHKITATSGLFTCQVNSLSYLIFYLGKTMSCLEDMQTWLFRDNPSKTFTYSTDDDVNVQEVIHHMTVHFPDVELPDAFSAAVDFLNPPSRLGAETKGGWYGVKPRNTMTYGADSLSWFDKKFRGRTESCPTCTYFTVK